MQFINKLFSKSKKAELLENDLLPEEDLLANRFRQVLGIKIKNSRLLVTALKHRSYLNVTNEDRIASNERLEFLGDAVLDLVTTQKLYHKFPKRTEGQLSKIKSILVSKPVLAEIAKDISLGKFLLINKGEEKTGGRNRQSILADALESVVGAIYLDQGLETVTDFIDEHLFSKFKTIMQRELYKNYKSILLEHAQSQNGKTPTYKVLQELGPDHDKEFVVGVFINGKLLAQGTGKSKKMAEQEAAKFAIRKLGLNKVPE